MGSLGVPAGGLSVSGRDALTEVLKSKTCVGLGLDEALFAQLASSAEGQAAITAFLEDERAADTPLLVYEVRTEVIRKKEVASIAPKGEDATEEEGATPAESTEEEGRKETAGLESQVIGRASASDGGDGEGSEVVERTSGIAPRESSSGRLSGAASTGPSRRASTLAASSRRESALVHPEPLAEASGSDEKVVAAEEAGPPPPEEKVEVDTVVELRACLGSLPEGTAGRAVYFTKKEAGKLRSKDGIECGVLAEGPSLRALEVVRHACASLRVAGSFRRVFDSAPSWFFRMLQT